MNTIKKFLTPLVLLIALLAIGGGAVLAQSRDAFGRLLGYHDHRESVRTFAGPLSANTAQVFTGVEGKRLVVKSLCLSSSAAGVVTFQDGSGGPAIAHLGLEANKPLEVPDDVLGFGIRATAGNGIYAVFDSPTDFAVFARVWNY